jgi:hypothetical protein
MKSIIYSYLSSNITYQTLGSYLHDLPHIAFLLYKKPNVGLISPLINSKFKGSVTASDQRIQITCFNSKN